jgi:hypothetical protein
MTIEDTSKEPETSAPEAKELSDAMSFSEYEAARRGGGKFIANKSASTEEVGQKPAANSEAAKKEDVNSDESDDESELEDSDELDDSEKDKPKKKSGFKRRVDKLNARVAEKERELEYWKMQALKDASASKKETVEKTPEDKSKPNQDNYESHAEFLDAFADWKLDQREKAAKQAEEKSKVVREQETLRKTYVDRAKSFAEKVKDFKEVLESVDDVRVTPAIEQIILSSDNGPELAYELAKNREEYERICNLSPLEAARAIGRIESKLLASSDEKKIETKKLTTAPKPIAPVGGSKGTASKSLADPDLSYTEYERIRREQLKRKRA